ncbi:hypothetical protein CVD19_09705 [Bacillus sp. T33-2]|nr:hypothetical protein CVD19_09705 [Bacillus sp. T33-2]
MKDAEEEVYSFSANKKWLAIPEDFRRQLVRNVFCASCLGVVQVEKYTITDSPHGIVLHGQCKTCGHPVARVVD